MPELPGCHNQQDAGNIEEIDIPEKRKYVKVKEDGSSKMSQEQSTEQTCQKQRHTLAVLIRPSFWPEAKRSEGSYNGRKLHADSLEKRLKPFQQVRAWRLPKV